MCSMCESVAQVIPFIRVDVQNQGLVSVLEKYLCLNKQKNKGQEYCSVIGQCEFLMYPL